MVKYLIRTLADDRVFFTLEYNGFVMLTSEPQTTIEACLAGLEKVRVVCKDYRAYQKNLSLDLQFYFVLKGLRGEVLGKSGFFETAVQMEVCVELVHEHGRTAFAEQLAVAD